MVSDLAPVPPRRTVPFDWEPGFYEPAGLWLYGNARLLSGKLAYIPLALGNPHKSASELDEIERDSESQILNGFILTTGPATVQVVWKSSRRVGGMPRGNRQLAPPKTAYAALEKSLGVRQKGASRKFMPRKRRVEREDPLHFASRFNYRGLAVILEK